MKSVVLVVGIRDYKNDETLYLDMLKISYMLDSDRDWCCDQLWIPCQNFVVGYNKMECVFGVLASCSI